MHYVIRADFFLTLAAGLITHSLLQWVLDTKAIEKVCQGSIWQ
jgi:hypothetical protein